MGVDEERQAQERRRAWDGSSEPPTAGGGRNAEANFHGQKRRNDTHASSTDPQARLYRKGRGKETRLCFIGHSLMANRSGLVVDACLTLADGHAERVPAQQARCAVCAVCPVCADCVVARAPDGWVR